MTQSLNSEIQKTNVAKNKTGLSALRDKFRYGLVLLSLRDALIKLGIEITPFYWMKEGVPDAPDPQFDVASDEYEFSFFDAEDIECICDLPERSFVSREHVRKIYAKGTKCYGAKYNGEIAGFSWFDLDECFSRLYKTPMKSNEAYLFDVYVLNAFRGKNLAPLLRQHIYGILREKGIDSFYSITEAFNTPSIRIKQKLNARFVFLGLYVRLFRKRKKTWILKRYQ